MTDDETDPLVTRLRAAGPTRGLGVDFAEIAQEAGRRHRRRRAARAVGASVITVAAVGLGAQALGGLGGASSTSSSLAAPSAPREADAGARADGDTGGVGPAPAAGAPSTFSRESAAPPSSASLVAAARSALGCPAAVTPAGPGLVRVPVPQLPTPQLLAALPQLQDQVLPAAGALSAVVCRYDEPFESVGSGRDGAASQPLALTAERSVTAGLAALTADLSALPPADPGGTGCPTTAGRSSHLLLRVDYPQGAVWVSAEADVNSCAGATNGVITTARPLGAALLRLAETGVWAGR